MNFGDILNKWEKVQTGGISAKKYLEKWLNENEVFDKDANEETVSARGKNRRRLLRIKPDDILDIHGLTSEQAWLSMDKFFSNAKDAGYKKLRIIHGKGIHTQGGSILVETVRKFIEKCPFAGESGFEKPVNGGTGATWVLLK